jgi:outer membrane protein OmpA-like peptidoglycan-associated protein
MNGFVKFFFINCEILYILHNYKSIGNLGSKLINTILKKLLKYGFFFMLAIFSFNECFTQAPIGEITYNNYIPNTDSAIVFTRKHGSWWFGITTGTNISGYYGNLNLPLNPDRPVDTTNKVINFNSGSGSGIFLGFFGEWLPPGKSWGADLKILLLDYRRQISDSKAENLDSIKLYYESRTNIYYAALSGSLRYNFPIKGLHAFAGFDIDFPLSYKSRFQYMFEYTGKIQDVRIMPLKEIQLRYGYHLGFGYDLFVTDIHDMARLDFSPFVSIHSGSSIINDFGSSLNTYIFKIGLNVKIGFDDISKDTILIERSPVPTLASLDRALGNVTFPGFVPFEALPAAELAYLPKAMIMEEISEKPVPAPLNKEKSEKPAVTKIIPNKTEMYTYNNPPDIDITDEMKSYLNEVAAFVKANPGCEIRVVGHSDNSGTFEQRQLRSKMRTEQVVRYLVNRGVPRGRILDRFRGAIAPIATNETPEGRKKNRRVEIVVVQ